MGCDDRIWQTFVVPLNYISPFIRQATIAIEDKTFYKNSGIDFGGIARAAIADYTHHHLAQGGSTISQQLVKQVFIGPNPLIKTDNILAQVLVLDGGIGEEGYRIGTHNDPVLLLRHDLFHLPERLFALLQLELRQLLLQ